MSITIKLAGKSGNTYKSIVHSAKDLENTLNPEQDAQLPLERTVNQEYKMPRYKRVIHTEFEHAMKETYASIFAVYCLSGLIMSESKGFIYSAAMHQMSAEEHTLWKCILGATIAVAAGAFQNMISNGYKMFIIEYHDGFINKWMKKFRKNDENQE